MNVVEEVKNLQENAGNRIPNIVFYMQLASKFSKTDIRSLLNIAVLKGELSWGRTPFTEWYAVKLTEYDKEVIKDSKGWTIEEEIE